MTTRYVSAYAIEAGQSFAGKCCNVGPRAMPDTAVHHAPAASSDPALVAALDRRSLVLVGMMAAGKSSVGRRLGTRL